MSTMLKMTIVDDYKNRESNRVVNLAKTVFDLDKDSPYYNSSKDFIDLNEQIRI